MFVPRNIPLMESRTERLARVVRDWKLGPPQDFLQGDAPMILPPHSEGTLLLDQAYLTTAYPELITSGGRGAVREPSAR